MLPYKQSIKGHVKATKKAIRQPGRALYAGNESHRVAESIMASLVTFVGCFLHLLLISVFSTVLGDWNTKDYLKREHSLVKPYQSKLLFS